MRPVDVLSDATSQGRAMNLLNRIYARKRVKSFSDQPVAREALLEIIRAGASAPSVFNNRPWRFILVREKDLRQKILRLANQRECSSEVDKISALIMVFVDHGAMCHFTLDYQAIGACLQNMLLAADFLDLGAVWLGRILERSEEVRPLLDITENMELMAVVAVGHTQQSTRRPRRRSLKRVLLKEI